MLATTNALPNPMSLIIYFDFEWKNLTIFPQTIKKLYLQKCQFSMDFRNAKWKIDFIFATSRPKLILVEKFTHNFFPKSIFKPSNKKSFPCFGNDDFSYWNSPYMLCIFPLSKNFLNHFLKRIFVCIADDMYIFTIHLYC